MIRVWKSFEQEVHRLRGALTATEASGEGER